MSSSSIDIFGTASLVERQCQTNTHDACANNKIFLQKISERAQDGTQARLAAALSEFGKSFADVPNRAVASFAHFFDRKFLLRAVIIDTTIDRQS